MATLHDYFVDEVAEHLGLFEEALERGESSNREQLHRAARALRGTAQIAREDAAFRAANVLESATRALLDGRLQLDAATVDRLRASAGDLRAIARGADDDARADAIVARWAEIGIDARARDRPGSVAQETRAFLEFAAQEVQGIAAELEHSLKTLMDAPMDRESLKAVLRRQRALLGSARLQEIPILAETLRAVEDLTGVIAKLDVAVRNEWLDVFRSARDVLTSAASRLETGHQPEPGTALSRLRVLREELVDRHGKGEAVSAVSGGAGLSQAEVLTQDGAAAVAAAPSQDVAPALASAELLSEAAPESGPPTRPPADDVDVRELQYRGESALQRAAELRPILERMLADHRGGREALAELYDLMRLARE